MNPPLRSASVQREDFCPERGLRRNMANLTTRRQRPRTPNRASRPPAPAPHAEVSRPWRSFKRNIGYTTWTKPDGTPFPEVCFSPEKTSSHHCRLPSPPRNARYLNRTGSLPAAQRTGSLRALAARRTPQHLSRGGRAVNPPPRSASLQRRLRRNIADLTTRREASPGGDHLSGQRPRMRGSNTSRRASPSMLNPNTAPLIASPGQIDSHGDCSMYARPVPLSIDPHVGNGGGTP